MKRLATPWDDRVLILRCGPLSAENLEWFSGAELDIANAFRLEKRRHEWLHARLAAKTLARELGACKGPRHCAVGRPTLILDGALSSWFVSLSHSAPWAGAALSREPVGLDVQTVRDLPEHAAHLFLSDEETAAMQSCTLPYRILHFWSAKEAAWKQRSDEFATLKQLPLRLRHATASGLVFDAVETIVIEDVIVAVTVGSEV